MRLVRLSASDDQSTCRWVIASDCVCAAPSLPFPYSAAPQVGNDNRTLWYAAGYWYLGKKNELGKSQGWLCVRDPAPAPELVQSCWRVGDGERLHQVH